MYGVMNWVEGDPLNLLKQGCFIKKKKTAQRQMNFKNNKQIYFPVHCLDLLAFSSCIEFILKALLKSHSWKDLICVITV